MNEKVESLGKSMFDVLEINSLKRSEFSKMLMKRSYSIKALNCLSSSNNLSVDLYFDANFS